MKHNYTGELSTAYLKELQQVCKDYEKWLKEKCDALAEKLATLGATSASIGFAQAVYDSPHNDFNITVHHNGEGSYTVRADGTDVLFVEFGAGATMGKGHPEAGDNKMGPGTYNPQSDNWKNPYGWWYSVNGTKYHSYGNPPNMPMYNAVKNLEQELQSIVTEVFK